jgi:hypothetical protein
MLFAAAWVGKLRGSRRLLTAAISCPSIRGAETDFGASILTYLLSAILGQRFTVETGGNF